MIFVPMKANLVLMIVPSAGIADTKANAMAEAMRAYSIAVAPDSLLMKIPNLIILFSNVTHDTQLADGDIFRTVFARNLELAATH